MISAEFTTKTIKQLLPLLVILALGIFLRISLVGKLYPFDHDQEFVANSAYSLWIENNLTLIGQELSFPGFFLGSAHNLILALPYGLCNLSPVCAPYFLILMGTITIVLLYFLTKTIFDRKIAAATTAIYSLAFVAISSEIGASSNFFLFLSSVAMLFAIYKYYQYKDFYLPLGAFVAGIATVNFNPVFIFSAAAFFVAAFIRKERPPLIYFSAVCAFAANYLPLVIFNNRHQNILFENLRNFLSQNAQPLGFLERLRYLLVDVVLPYWSNYLFNSSNAIFIATTAILLGLGIYTLSKKSNKFLPLLVFWLVVPLLGFSLYGGDIPDYYFMQTLLAVILLTAITISRNLLMFLTFIAIFTFVNLKSSITYQSGINYSIKQKVVDFVVNDSSSDSYNVYYDFPPGLGTGYNYLFKIKSNRPEEGGKNLYILELFDHTDILKYKRSFPNKSVTVTTIGFVNITSVK